MRQYNTSGKYTNYQAFDTKGNKTVDYDYNSNGSVTYKHFYKYSSKGKLTDYKKKSSKNKLIVDYNYHSNGKVSVKSYYYSNGKKKEIRQYYSNGKTKQVSKYNSKGKRTYYKTYKSTTQNTNSNTNSSQSKNPEEEVLSLVNAERKKLGVSPLKLDSELTKVAYLKSKDMAEKNYFSHQSPTYGGIGDMADKFNISYSIIGENIACGQQTPEHVVKDWMSSPGHRGNIISPDYGKLGVGVYEKNGVIYWTQIFTN